MLNERIKSSNFSLAILRELDLQISYPGMSEKI